MFKIIKYSTFILSISLIMLVFYVMIQHVIRKDFDINQIDVRQIGSGFTGIVAPIGIFFAVLTYFFNRESNEKRQIETYYTLLNNDIADANFEGKKGVDAYLAFSLNTQTKNVVLDNINLVVSSFEMYINLINKNVFVSKSFKEVHKKRLYLLFYSKVLWPLHETITTHGKEFINGKHDDSKITLPKFAKLSLESIRYLKGNNLSQDSPFKDSNIKLLEQLINA